MNTALSPVTFHGDTIFCTTYQNQPYTAMKPIIENMGLDWGTQFRKLSGCKERWSIVIMTMVASDGKDRDVLCMPVRKLPAFLNTINPKKVRPELRERIELYQAESDDVLWEYWTKQQSSSPLTPDLRAELKALVDAKLSMVPEDVQGKARAELWTRFDRYFKIAEYAQLPAHKMPEAREYIINLELRALRGAESQKQEPAKKSLPKPKECTLSTNRKEIEAMQKKLELLCQTVQLTGLSSTTLGGERAERLLTESRNRHVRTAVNCLIMANMALEYAIA